MSDRKLFRSSRAKRVRRALKFLESAKGAVPRRHTTEELPIPAARTRPVLRGFLQSKKLRQRARDPPHRRA